MNNKFLLLLLMPILAFGIAKEPPCKPIKNKRKLERIKSNIHFELKIKSWDSITHSYDSLQDKYFADTNIKFHAWVAIGSFFPGGPEAFCSYIKDRITPCKFLQKLKKKKYQFSFIVNTCGYPQNIILQNEKRDKFSSEIISIIINSPKWIPTQINGKSIDTEFKMNVWIGK